MNKLIKNPIYWFIFLPLWFYIIIGPMLYSGYIGDDAYNSQIYGDIFLQEITIWERFYNEVSGWLVGAGRFYPLGWLNYVWFYYIDNIFVTKLINFLLIYLGTIVLAIIFFKLKKEDLFIKLFTLSLPVIMQFTMWMDPVLGWSFFMPGLFLYLVLSLLFLLFYIDSGKTHFIFLSCLFYLFSLITYEIAYPLWIIHVLIIYSVERDFKKVLIKGAPIILLGLFAIVSYFFFQWYFIFKTYNVDHTLGTYPGSSIHLESISKVFQAFAKQSLGGFPFLNSLKSLYIYGLDIFWSISIFSWSLFIIGICYFYKKIFSKYINLHKKIKHNNSLNKPNLYDVCFGLLLIFLPAAVVALSGHQQVIIDETIGNTYLPEYIQFFGVAILVSYLLYYLFTWDLSSKFIYYFKCILLLFCTIAAALTMASNTYIVKLSDPIFKYPRNLLENSLRAGILDEVNKDDVIIRSYKFPHDNAINYAKITKKNLNICRLDDSLYECLKSFFPDKFADFNPYLLLSEGIGSRSIYYLDYTGNVQKSKNGGVFVDKISSLNFNSNLKLVNMMSASKYVSIYNESNKEKSISELISPHYYLSENNFSEGVTSAINNDKYCNLFWALKDNQDQKSTFWWSSGKSTLSIFCHEENQDYDINLQLINTYGSKININIKYPNESHEYLLDKRLDIKHKFKSKKGLSRIELLYDIDDIANENQSTIILWRLKEVSLTK